MLTEYCLQIEKNNKLLELSVTANDAGHAQAQAKDIMRAFCAEKTRLTYKKITESYLSELFKKLAYNEYNHKECSLWTNKFCNGSPVIYALGTKYYVRPLILDYLEITKDQVVTPTCGDKHCINPFHNSYKKSKAAKLTGADLNLALAFAGQGVPVREIAKALKVHRSTIYRTLKNERLYSGSSSQGQTS